MYGGRILRNTEKRTGAASADSGAECIFKHIQHTVIFRKIRNKKCIRQYSLNELCKTYNFLQKISTPANIHIREEVKIVI